jgi:hypothetical protein
MIKASFRRLAGERALGRFDLDLDGLRLRQASCFSNPTRTCGNAVCLRPTKPTRLRCALPMPVDFRVAKNFTRDLTEKYQGLYDMGREDRDSSQIAHVVIPSIRKTNGVALSSFQKPNAMYPLSKAVRLTKMPAFTKRISVCARGRLIQLLGLPMCLEQRLDGRRS